MSNMGNTIVDIQEMANAGIPNEAISKATKTSIDFVTQVVDEMFKDQAEYYTDAGYDYDD